MPGKNEFTALVLEESDGKVTSSLQTLSDDALPDRDVTIDVAYSTLNYKDGMIVSGLGNMVKSYPHVPGIDLVGTVSDSQSPDFKPGDQVILTGWRVGEAHWGGYSTKARAKSEWLVRVPDGLSLKRSMALGTAGLTAMMSVMVLEEHGLVPGGEVLVTGAAGGVGSVAVALLASLGHRVAASTGRAETHDYLRDLGAAAIIDRPDLETPPKGSLGSERWAGAIDNVGGSTLATVLGTLVRGGSCASVGLAAGPRLETTVIPFLLRGVNLLGIDSGHCPMDRRIEAWRRLAAQVPMDKLDAMTTEAPLSEVADLGGKILQGQVRGRTVIDVHG